MTSQVVLAFDNLQARISNNRSRRATVSFMVIVVISRV